MMVFLVPEAQILPELFAFDGMEWLDSGKVNYQRLCPTNCRSVDYEIKVRVGRHRQSIPGIREVPRKR